MYSYYVQLYGQRYYFPVNHIQIEGIKLLTCLTAVSDMLQTQPPDERAKALISDGVDLTANGFILKNLYEHFTSPGINTTTSHEAINIVLVYIIETMAFIRVDITTECDNMERIGRFRQYGERYRTNPHSFIHTKC